MRRVLLVLLLTFSLLPGAAEAARRPAYGGAVAIARTPGLPLPDPAVAQGPRELAIVRALHAGLYRLAADGEPHPHLLDAALVPQAGRSGRVHRGCLRDGLRFHDGRSLSTRDVRRSLKRLAREKGSPLAGLAAGLTVRVTGRRCFELLSPEAVPLPELELVLALPQAAVVPPSRERLVGLGPFRVADRESPLHDDEPLRLVAWEEAPDGRPFLDEIVLLPTAAGRAEAEAFHYERLDVSFTSSARIRRHPTVRSEQAEMLYLVFADKWRRGTWRQGRRKLLTDVAAHRDELLRHLDYPAEATTRLWPAGETAKFPDGDDWEGGPLTIVRPAESPELAEVAGALRDVLSRQTAARVVAVPAAEFPPRAEGAAHDLRLMTAFLPSGLGAVTRSLLAARLGLGDAGSLAEGALVAPLLVFRRLAVHAAGLRNLRFSRAGAPVLEDAWWQGGEP